MNYLKHAICLLALVHLYACGADDASADSSDTPVFPIPTDPTEPQAQTPTPSNPTVGPQGPTGAKGEKGEKGDQGPAGKNGKDGEKGLDGDTGSQGPAGTPVDPNQWLDPISDRLYLIGAPQTPGQMNFQNPCASPYRLPTKQETTSAVTRGLSLASQYLTGGAAAIWTGDFQGPDRISIDSTGTERAGVFPQGNPAAVCTTED